MRELIVDNFAGGGGASTGIEIAIGRSVDIAINHDPAAIAMHKANHPASEHYCENVWNVDPVKACAGRPVALAWFSPDCKHFSKAKGGKPCDKNIRGLAWVAVRWAKKVRPRVIMMENVEEIQTWGPLGPDNRPDPAHIGDTFRKFIRELEHLGYVVEHRELVAADFGAPTTRNRWYLIARCDGKPIIWPDPTHAERSYFESFLPAAEKRQMKPWVPVSDVIDWSLPCPSIFDTREEIKEQYGLNAVRPLSDKTLRRIARGIKKFVLDNPSPFIVNCNHTTNHGVYECFRGQGIDEPLQTITSHHGYGVVMPTLIQYHDEKPGEDARGQTVDRPIMTLDTSNRYAMIVPMLVHTGYGEREGQLPRALDIEKPLGTVVGTGKHALVSAFISKYYDGNYQGSGSSMDEPVHTITSRDHNAICAAHIIKLKGTNLGQTPNDPLQTITASGLHFGEVRAFMVKYYGTATGQEVDEPLDTVTSHDTFGLVTVQGTKYAIVDIGIRMLSPRELFDAQGFPHDYVIDVDADGNPYPKAEQVARCGNAVCPPVPAALVRANLPELCKREAA